MDDSKVIKICKGQEKEQSYDRVRPEMTWHTEEDEVIHHVYKSFIFQNVFRLKETTGL